jgi:hypothetical protein
MPNDINIKALPELSQVVEFNDESGIQVERSTGAVIRHTMDQLGFSTLSLLPEMARAAAGATIVSSARGSYVAFPDSTASGNPVAQWIFRPPVGWEHNRGFKKNFTAWYFTTAALSTALFARMDLAAEWFDVGTNPNTGTTERFSEAVLLSGSTAVDTWVIDSQGYNNTDLFNVTSKGYQLLSIRLTRTPDSGSDDLTTAINLRFLQLGLGTTST